jgi:RNA polymerase sigma-70 factor (ECF subfamily)
MKLDLDDKKLVENFLAGDDRAFELLVEKYLKTIYNFLRQFISDQSALEDVTQVTFIKVWKNIRRYEQKKSFKTWVFTIAKNTAFDYLKKKKTVPFSDFIDDEGNSPLENISADDILPDEMLEREDFAKDLEEKLKKIPENYRVILLMHYKEDFSLQEISQILDRSYNTIKSQHSRALQALRKVFEK